MDAHAATTDATPVLRVRFRGGELLDAEAISLDGLLQEFADVADATPLAEIVHGLLGTGSFEDLTWERGMRVSYFCERPEALHAQLPR